jgi:prepilin-type N-terminal cleavage/methylation domain-containing protein
MNRAFTLIELLIVVAIIAILAAIAVPNFIEAQTRAKVSRAMADMRTLITGIEAYTVDHNDALGTTTFDNGVGGTINPMIWSAMVTVGSEGPVGGVTTPISYLTTLPRDPFTNLISVGASGARSSPFFRYFLYDKAGFGFVAGDIFPNLANTWVEIRKDGLSDPAHPGFNVNLPADCEVNGIHSLGLVTVQRNEIGRTPRRYVLWSSGPQQTSPSYDSNPTCRYHINYRYDPTNGTSSNGALLAYPGGPNFPQ